MSTDETNDPLEHLGREHAELERVLRLLESMLDALQAGEHVSRAELAGVVDYITVFGDLRHHDKEESLLVPVLIQHGFDWYDGPMARLRRDHRQERYLVRVLSDLASQERPWSSEDQRHLLGTGREFIAFLRAHMAFENDLVLSAARGLLPKQAKARLMEEFRRFDEEHAGSTTFTAKRTEVESLFEKYLHSVSSRPSP